ncbi:LysR family transcriptional regulator [uncultured Tateyamaria sp.]|uniref:LysR family transcriptional regulator n=1 Tax=uncultured Tateyamaria sp. TaxID=455651 RepID=UPI002607EA37|nr:LysR family transcriptional regulator [uncultured Tateyamaria sp.]
MPLADVQEGIAKMQEAAWDDVRVFRAVVEEGSFAAAARALGQHETTVARHVHRLERVLGHVLWRGAAGGVTDEGAVVMRHAQAMADAAAQVAATRQSPVGPRGAVRLTSVPWVIAEAVVPVLSQWRALAPDVSVSVIGAHESFNLLHGEADVALRLARPEAGGDVIARKLCDVDFVVAGSGAQWIGYVSEMAHVPQAQWTEAEAGSVGLRVSDQSGVVAAVAAGLGRGWVPACLAAGRRVGTEVRTRPLWCLTHPRTRHAPAVRAVRENMLPLVRARLSQ